MSTTFLVAVLLAAPLVAALLGLLLTALRGAGLPAPRAERWLSILAVGLSFACVVLLWMGKPTPIEEADHREGEEAATAEHTESYGESSPAVTGVLFDWISVPAADGKGEAFKISIGYIIDELSLPMLLVVTGVGFLIHIFSLGYMGGDKGRARYFIGLSVFMFSMLGIVLADNFLMMFIFWELVGVSSYLLIGHWFHKPSAAAASLKAFIVNRLGDFGFMLGILMLWAATGTLVFTEMSQESVMAGLTGNPVFLTVATLLVFCGAVGKSAQFPLHVWLPDAMEGPTPVSALIHAATMVAAGVYMMARVFFLVEGSAGTDIPVDAATMIMIIGAVTAFIAALMATEQNDIKRVLAYSTLSQLGYMVMAIGALAPEAAMFHLITHAFFKALLFLGAGAIIHQLHHEQDIWKMGGLLKRMPITTVTFTIGTLALIGFPYLFSGFWSKDYVLIALHEKETGNQPVFWLAAFTAALTAFYMVRLWLAVFTGRPRSGEASTATEAPFVMWLPLAILAVFSIVAGYPFIQKLYLQLPHGEHDLFVPIVSIIMFALGLVVAALLFRGKTRQPFEIPFISDFFRNRFYIDDAYRVLVRCTHDLLAAVSGFIDRYVIDLLLVQGLGATIRSVGGALRQLQVGNLQVYSLAFAIGVLVLLYLVVAL